MTRARDWLVAAFVLLLGRGHKPPPAAPEHRIVEAGAPDRKAENYLLVLLGLATAAAVAFIVFYAWDGSGHQTQWLGLTIGLAFIFLALACLVISRRLVVTEELVETYPVEEHPEAQGEVEQILAESGSRLTRKRLVTLAGAGAVGALGLAAVVPALSLGPLLDTSEFYKTPWKRGRRLVGEDGRPLRADEIEEAAFYTAYPQGADRELIGSPVVVVRLDPASITSDRRSWAPGGIVAFSKICTHAGCAIALYRKPTFAQVEPRPALVCPCHYSTFDPAQAGKVLFGPAGRPLPQLPLQIFGGQLRAAGNFSGPVGPSWWGVRSGKARS